MRRDRVVVAATVACGEAALLWLLAHGWARERAEPPTSHTEAVELALPPPPRQSPPPRAHAPRTAHAAAPPALKAEATSVAAPPPLVRLEIPPPLVAAPVPGEGAAAHPGAAAVPGPGTGAGGVGQGSGAGGAGGDGDDDETPPRWRHGRLKDSDYPAGAAGRGAAGTVAVIFTVETDGHVDRCQVERSSGDPDLDATTCRLIEKRYRYDPARDADGRPIPSRVGESHSWAISREVESPDRP